MSAMGESGNIDAAYSLFLARGLQRLEQKTSQQRFKFCQVEKPHIVPKQQVSQPFKMCFSLTATTD